MSYAFGDEYFRAEKVRIIKNISDPDYFRADKIRIIDNISDPDYFRADKIRIIDNISDPDYFRARKVRNISNISDPDYFRARKVRVVKLTTYSTQASITKSKQGSGGIGGFCLVVIAVLLVGGLITAIAGFARQNSSATSNYTAPPLNFSSTLNVSPSPSTSEIENLITSYYNQHGPYPGILVVKSIGDMSFAKQNDTMFITCAEITVMSLPGEPSEGDQSTYFIGFQFDYGGAWTITSEGDASDTMEGCYQNYNPN